jgi:hypothetical protein
MPCKSLRKEPEIPKWQLPCSTVMLEIPVRRRDEPVMIWSDEGMKNESNDEQEINAWDSTRSSFEPGSNVNNEREWQQPKQWSQRTSTFEGIQIDVSDEQSANAYDSI